MKSRKIKLDKNPDNIFGSTHLLNYIFELESKQRLNELPESLLVYFVLKQLYNEIMNGGYYQYLFNHYNDTYPFLYVCNEKINEPELKQILSKYITMSDNGDIINKEISNIESVKVFEDLDSRFVALDHKINLPDYFKKMYSDLYGENPIYMNIELDSKVAHEKFFKWYKNGISLELAVDSFVEFLAKLELIKWDIIIEKIYDIFIISAKSTKLLNLDNIIDKFLEEKSVHNMLFFQSIRIKNIIDNKHDEISIVKSGFAKDEYVINRQQYTFEIQLEKEYKAMIMLGASNSDLQLGIYKFKVDDVIKHLEEIAKRHESVNQIIVIE